MINPGAPPALICTCFAAALLAPSYVNGTDAIAAFDAAVLGPLPHTVVLHGRNILGRGTWGGSALTITHALDVDVRLPDGAGAQSWLATLDGKPAVATRSAGHLDVAVPHADGVDITGYDERSDEPHHVGVNGPQPMSSGADPIDSPVASVPRNARTTQVARDLSFLDAGNAKPTLTLWMFLHDDTADVSRQHIHAGYVSWWLADMQRLLPSYRLRTYYIDRRKGMTDIAYGEKVAAMDRWTKAAQAYATEAKLPYKPGREEYKFMLIVKDLVAPSTSGLAWHGGDQAIASLAGSWSIVAHEFGHTLTAAHDDSSMWWSYVWPCATNLYPTDYKVVSNCYRYTAANERRITEYLARKDDGPLAVEPSGKALTMVE